MTRAGLYLHIPFCRSRCSYCDFSTGLYNQEAVSRYLKALIGEISKWRQACHWVNSPAPIDTIYFGGGTPSLLTTRQIEVILKALSQQFSISSDAEITIEINPGTVNLQALQDLRKLGVNRASFGVQTFDNDELRRIGRSHTAEDALLTLHNLRQSGFDNVSFDLIAGLPLQNISGWSRNLLQALTLKPSHLSLYLLEVHEGTPLGKQLRLGMWPRPDPDEAAEMYRIAAANAVAAGYVQYEISNFCLPGYHSRHNAKYWTGDPYYGFGCSAHSFDGARHRWSNERDMMDYVNAVENGKGPVVETLELDKASAASEAVFLGLRLLDGINTRDYDHRFGINIMHSHTEELARLIDAGLVEFDDPILRLTSRGALLSNEVFAIFV